MKVTSVEEENNHEIYSEFGGPLKNTKLHFLILLNKDDYEKNSFDSKCNKMSVEELLLANSNLFGGILHCFPYEDIEDTKALQKYIIEENPIQKEIYIKLPKEKIYVSHKNFEFKYLLSQHNELISIFVLLGAKKIKWDISKSYKKKIAKKLELGTNVQGIDLKVGGNNDEKENEESEVNNFIEFKDRGFYLTEEAFVKNDYFFYLSKKPEWHEIIKLRSRGEKSYKFKYTYTKLHDFDFSLISKLKFINIQCNFMSSDFNNLSIKYDVEYY
jgi:hypothetical protein